MNIKSTYLKDVQDHPSEKNRNSSLYSNLSSKPKNYRTVPDMVVDY